MPMGKPILFALATMGAAMLSQWVFTLRADPSYTPIALTLSTPEQLSEHLWVFVERPPRSASDNVLLRLARTTFFVVWWLEPPFARQHASGGTSSGSLNHEEYGQLASMQILGSLSLSGSFPFPGSNLSSLSSGASLPAAGVVGLLQELGPDRP